MRTFFPTLSLGAMLVTGLSGASLFAQNQPQDQQQPSAATSQASPATNQPKHAVNPRRAARRMAKKLGLSPDQESKLEPILADRQQQIESTRSDTTLAQKAMRAKLRGIRQDSDAKVQAILTDAQKQQYEQMKQSHKANRQQPGAASTNG